MHQILDSTLAYKPDRYTNISLKFHYSLYSNMIDKFGNHIKRNIKIYDQDYLTVTIDHCPISSTFYGWIIGFDGLIQIDGPIDEVNHFKSYLVDNYIK